MISTKRAGLRFAFPLVVGLAALATACGSSGSSSTATTAPASPGATSAGGGASPGCPTGGSLTGGGSTFVQNIALEWIKNYQAMCKGTSINYQGVGSGAGITQFTAGTLQFGATDVPLTSSQISSLQPKGAYVQIPWASGGISLEYNLPNVKALNLDATTIAEIFDGKITSWNDHAIEALNPGVSLPSTHITTVHRSDSSGTSAAFSLYLEKAAPSAWTLGSNKTWPGPGGQGAKGSDQVTATVKQTTGAIGYAEVSYAVGAGLPMVAVKNQAGKFVTPMDSSSVSATMASATVASDGSVTVNYATPNPAAYPIVTATYVVAFKSQRSDFLKDFMLYAVGDGQASAAKLFYAPLPQNIVSAAKTSINTMTTSS